VLVLVVVLDLLAVKKTGGVRRRERDALTRSFALAPSAVSGRSFEAGRSFLETRRSQINLISA
jgi:hypothetical protein